jgi:release factor glutamine methyltransferase
MLPALTVLEVIKKTAEFFSVKGIESPRLNAEILVGQALQLPRMQLYLQFERPLAEAELEAIRTLVRRRGLREPLQYILGVVEFHGLKLKADRRALIPRPETERLVEILIERGGDSPPAQVLDLGTGGGAIALALAAAWRGAAVVAVDKSAEALALARENAVATGLDGRINFVLSNWFSSVPADLRADLVVANPPYLSEEEHDQAAAEIRDFEPASALVSTERGIGASLAILRGAGRFLAPGGWLALETGSGQHEALREAAMTAGWARTESLGDLAGRERYFFAWTA